MKLFCITVPVNPMRLRVGRRQAVRWISDFLREGERERIGGGGREGGRKGGRKEGRGGKLKEGEGREGKEWKSESQS